MNEFENVETTRCLQLVDELDEFRGAETEFALLTAALRPATGAFAGELDAHPARGRDPKVVGHFDEHIEFTHLLEHDEDLVSELLRHEGQPHELVVLVAIADDEMFGALRQSDHRLQFGLGTAFEPHAVRLAEAHDLFDHVALLIHLDRIHRGVAARVLELTDRAAETPAQGFDARSQDVRESQQHRQLDALPFEVGGEIPQIECPLRMPRIGTHDHVAAFMMSKYRRPILPRCRERAASRASP